MSEILREFKISIGLDSSPLNKGISGAESSLKRFATLAGSALTTLASLSALKGAISGFTELADKIGHASKMFGFSTSEAHALGNALKRFGGNTDSAINTLKSLSGALQEAKWGQGALIEMGRKYGVFFVKQNGQMMEAEELLHSLGKQMRGMDKLQQIEIGKKLGLDDSVILALQDGGVELEKLIKRQKQLGVITSKDYKIAQAFGNSWEELKEVFKASGFMIVRSILPVFQKLTKFLTSIFLALKKHRAFVVSLFVAMGLAMTPILLMLGKMAIASAVAFAPFFAVTGIITLIALALEDLYVYFKGGDSLVGQFAEKWKPLKTFLEFLKGGFEDLSRVFEEFMGFLKNPTWESFLNFAKDFGETTLKYLRMPFDVVWELMKNFGNYLSGFFKNIGEMIWGSMTESIRKLTDKLPDFIKNKLPDFTLKTPQLTSAPSVGNTTTNNTTNNGGDINIKIDGANQSPQDIADAIVRQIQTANQSVGAN